MSRSLILLSLLFLLLAPPALFASPVVTVLKVRGMMCASCAETVEKVLRKQGGIMEVSVDLKKDQATVTYDNARITPQQMVEALKKAGYGASPLAR